MKHLLIIFAIVLFAQPVIADSSDKDDHGELITNTKNRTVGSSHAQHAPIRSDLLLTLEESGITISFYDNFGTGVYQFTNNQTGDCVSGSVVAEAGKTEFVPFSFTSTTTFDFYIEFENGSWSRLTFGE